jgi:hypothetical protein
MLKACRHPLKGGVHQAEKKRGLTQRLLPLSGILKEIALHRTRMLTMAGEMFHQNLEIVKRQRPREKIGGITGVGLRPAQGTLDMVMDLGTEKTRISF